MDCEVSLTRFDPTTSPNTGFGSDTDDYVRESFRSGIHSADNGWECNSKRPSGQYLDNGNEVVTRPVPKQYVSFFCTNN